mmetsp:Transcript_1422/g.2264  ORF Transcript_1422/g.2264 Transcript_1422/m.2264 type:complete len:88 (+) Transcript_1422:2118-2381(+)
MVGQTLDNKRLSVLMKSLSIVGGLGMVLVGLMDYITWRIDNPIEFVMAFYFILFGVLGILCEFPIPYIAKYFSFLKKYIGKGVYFIL